jgi:diguanylate cyclase (GGDEF)-like protein
VLRLLASQAAVAIQQTGLRTKIGALALTDELTGLPTKRAFDVELPREVARSRRSDAPLCVAVIDLDHLSAFNMLRSEGEGDRLLSETAALWSSALRDVDMIGRLSGGEFAALLPSCTIGEAIEVADRVRSRTPRGQTASAGVAMWNGEEPADFLLGRAQEALAAAKAAGRDTTVAAD